MMARHPDGALVGLTHASSVMPVVRRSDGASGTVTCALVPLNTSALPNFPAAQVVPLATPLWFCPDASFTAVPEPSSKPKAATSPVVVCAGAAPANRNVEQIRTDGMKLDRNMFFLPTTSA